MLEVGVLEVESVELEGYLLIVPTWGVSRRPLNLWIPVHQLDLIWMKEDLQLNCVDDQMAVLNQRIHHFQVVDQARS
jgi:hypothetical protein